MTDDKWTACKHITGGTAESAIATMDLTADPPQQAVVCRPCAVTGIEELHPIDKSQLADKLAKAGIKEVLTLDDVLPKKADKSDIHPCNACERNKSNIILLSIEAESICKDLSDCPYIKLPDKP
jgi:hypothetical protein